MELTDEARPLLEDAVVRRRTSQGPRHPETLTAMNNLASLHKARRDLQAAAQIYTEALEARRECLGRAHPDTLTSANNLASCLMALGRLHEAEPLLVEASREAKKALGREHPHSVIFAKNLQRLRAHPMLAPLREFAGRGGEEDLY